MHPGARTLDIWLVAGATRLRVGPAGVLIGRAPRCDLRLDAPDASRHHALVHRRADGASLVLLGRRGVTVNGAPAGSDADGAPLADGDVLGFPGLELAVAFERTAGAADGDPGPAAWWLVPRDGAPVRVSHPGFRVGPGGDVALSPVDTEPHPTSLVFTPGDDGIDVTADGPWRRNGVALPAGLAVRLQPGDALAAHGLDWVVERTGRDAATTRALAVDDADADADDDAVDGDAGAPSEVALEFLPRGGRMRVVVDGIARAVWLAERRFALVVCLLDPPGPLRGGDVVPDEVVLARVWPRQRHKSRVDVNVLVSRLRGDLADADLPPTLVVRAPGGGGTRFPLAPGGTVTVG